MSVDSLCHDLRAEVAALRVLIASGAISPDAQTAFMGWHVRNSITHMVFIDRLATLAFSDPAAAAQERDAFVSGTAAASSAPADRFQAIAGYEERRLGLLSWEQLLGAWQTGLDELCASALVAGDAGTVQWFGSAMRAESLISARHMEVWAYGQDVFDAAKADRPDGERLRNVVEFGLKTFGFSFMNRGEPKPAIKPYLSLVSPDGTPWAWNDPQSPDRITGSARDFSLVVTQRRHVRDTTLAVQGDVAERWMAIAQCIAGAPMDGPAPVGPVA